MLGFRFAPVLYTKSISVGKDERVGVGVDVGVGVCVGTSG